jgi:threonine dehydratase
MIAALDVVAARRRLAPHLQPTPLRHSTWLSAATGADVFLKLESVQLTNAFKIRGALNAALRVAGAARARATAPLIVTASAGNHGRALALAAERLGLRTIVFAPATAPETKKHAIRAHGADLRETRDYDEAERAARAFAAAEHALYIAPYNHPDVIAGAGTIALEILDVLARFDVVVTPVGGGGLASGLAVAMKAAAPHVRIAGVEAAASTPFAVGRRTGRITVIEPRDSIADGLTGNLEPGSVTFDLVQRLVDDLVSVEEDEIAGAIRALASEEHLIAEGAGAAATAAVLSKRVVKAGQTAVVIVSGANIDIERFARLVNPAPLQP